MPHAAEEVTIVRNGIHGLAKNLRKKRHWSVSPHPPRLHRKRQDRKKIIPRETVTSNKNFKIKLDIFLREAHPTVT